MIRFASFPAISVIGPSSFSISILALTQPISLDTPGCFANLHRGTRFSYTFYYPAPPPCPGIKLGSSRSSQPESLQTFPIYQSISALDHEAMVTLTLPSAQQGDGAAKVHTNFAQYLERTKNTICGRHPIGVLLGALAKVEQDRAGDEAKAEKGTIVRWVRYEQSSQCRSIKDSSVSYASAYVVF
jgi:MEMO1 family protein